MALTNLEKEYIKLLAKYEPMRGVKVSVVGIESGDAYYKNFYSAEPEGYLAISGTYYPIRGPHTVGEGFGGPIFDDSKIKTYYYAAILRMDEPIDYPLYLRMLDRQKYEETLNRMTDNVRYMSWADVMDPDYAINSTYIFELAFDLAKEQKPPRSCNECAHAVFFEDEAAGISKTLEDCSKSFGEYQEIGGASDMLEMEDCELEFPEYCRCYAPA